MIGGNTRVNADVPPFFLYSGFNVTPIGVNTVGLERAKLDAAAIIILKKAYRLLYRCGLKLQDALDRIALECPSPHTAELTDFIKYSQRGICRP